MNYLTDCIYISRIYIITWLYQLPYQYVISNDNSHYIPLAIPCSKLLLLHELWSCSVSSWGSTLRISAISKSWPLESYWDFEIKSSNNNLRERERGRERKWEGRGRERETAHLIELLCRKFLSLPLLENWSTKGAWLISVSACCHILRHGHPNPLPLSPVHHAHCTQRENALFNWSESRKNCSRGRDGNAGRG